MKRKVPRLRTDEEAEAFLDQDLSDLDFSRSDLQGSNSRTSPSGSICGFPNRYWMP